MDARQYNYGVTIHAEFSAGHTVSKAVLIGLGSTTHGFDMGQRLYPAAFSQPLIQTSCRSRHRPMGPIAMMTPFDGTLSPSERKSM